MCDCDKENSDPVVEWSTGSEICRRCGVVMNTCLVDETGGLYMDSVIHSVYDPFTQSNHQSVTVVGGGRVSKRIRQISESNDIPGYVRNGYIFISNVAAANKYTTIIEEQTKELFCDMYRITQGGKACKMENNAASSFYFAFKINNLSRTVEEISRATGVDLKDMSATNKRFMNELQQKPYYAKMTNAMNPDNLILRFKDNLKTSDANKRIIAKTTMDVMQKIVDSSILEGKTPNTICATSMWLAVTRAFKSGKPVNKEQVAEACDIKPITLNKSVKLVIQSNVPYY